MTATTVGSKTGPGDDIKQVLGEIKTKLKDFATAYFSYGIKWSTKKDDKHARNADQAERLKSIFKTSAEDVNKMNETDRQNWQRMLDTALLIEAYAGHRSMVVRLLEKGADVNAVTTSDTAGAGTSGLSVYMLALLSERSEKKGSTTQARRDRLLKVLTNNKADLTAPSQALILAFQNKNLPAAEKFYSEAIAAEVFTNFITQGNVDALEWLIQKNNNLLKTEHNNMLPLVKAATDGKTEVVPFLIEKSAPGQGKALHALAQRTTNTNNYEKIVPLLKNGINETNLDNQTPLQVAINRKNWKMAKLLIENGANINPELLTALANEHQMPDLVVLFAKRAKINSDPIFINNGQNPEQKDLLQAELRMQKEIMPDANPQVRHLNATANLSSSNEFSETLTPLQNAINRQNLEVTQLLIKNGANVNPTDGPSPLLQAIIKNNFEIAQLLIENGADINPPDISLLQLAVDNKLHDLIPFLIEKGANTTTSAGISIFHYTFFDKKDLQAAELLKAEINVQDREGNTALHRAATAEEVQQLLVLGANPTLQNKNGQNPAVYAAAQKKNSKTTEALYAATATEELKNNINEQDLDGNTALHRATTAEEVEMLIKKGADQTIQNNNGDTPLHLAAKNDNRSITAALNADIENAQKASNIFNEAGETPLAIMKNSGVEFKSSNATWADEETVLLTLQKAMEQEDQDDIAELTNQLRNKEYIKNALGSAIGLENRTATKLLLKKISPQERLEIYSTQMSKTSEAIFTEWLGQTVSTLNVSLVDKIKQQKNTTLNSLNYAIKHQDQTQTKLLLKEVTAAERQACLVAQMNKAPIAEFTQWLSKTVSELNAPKKK